MISRRIIYTSCADMVRPSASERAMNCALVISSSLARMTSVFFIRTK